MVRPNIKCAWCTLSNKQKGRRHFPYLLDIWNTGGVLVLHWCVWLIDPSLTSCFSSISSIFNHFCLCSKYAHYTNHFLSKTTNYKAIFVKMLISNFSRKGWHFQATAMCLPTAALQLTTNTASRHLHALDVASKTFNNVLLAWWTLVNIASWTEMTTPL